MKKRDYHTITGRTLDLGRLGEKERKFLGTVQRKYAKGSEWSEFAAWWGEEFRRSWLPADFVGYRIRQTSRRAPASRRGRYPPPEYRDYLADLIEERYGSRYRFCKETGIDPGHLIRVFASRSVLSLQSLQRILEALHAALVMQREEDISERVRPEQAGRTSAPFARCGSSETARSAERGELSGVGS